MIAFNMFVEGIPIFYYGTEQAFNGGNDPANREPLWTHMDKNHALYKFTKICVETRKKHKVWDCPHIERFAETNLFAFSRCDVLVVTTNSRKEVTHTIGYHPYKVGQKVCNVFDHKECLTVDSTGLKVTIKDMTVKVWVPEETLTSQDEFAVLAQE